MTQINWGRLLIGGLIASVIGFITDGVLHEKLIHHQWEALVQSLHMAPPPHAASAFAYFAIFELGRGFLALFLYVLMRPRCGAGPKTAICAGVVAWIAFSLTGPAQFIPLGFFSVDLWWMAGAFQLVTSIVATLAGAAIYSEKG